MKLPRMRLTVRLMMVVVAVVGIIMGMKIELDNRKIWAYQMRRAIYDHRGMMYHLKELKYCKSMNRGGATYDSGRRDLFNPYAKYQALYPRIKSWDEEVRFRTERVQTFKRSEAAYLEAKKYYEKRLLLPWPAPTE